MDPFLHVLLSNIADLGDYSPSYYAIWDGLKSYQKPTIESLGISVIDIEVIKFFDEIEVEIEVLDIPSNAKISSSFNKKSALIEALIPQLEEWSVEMQKMDIESLLDETLPEEIARGLHSLIIIFQELEMRFIDVVPPQALNIMLLVKDKYIKSECRSSLSTYLIWIKNRNQEIMNTEDLKLVKFAQNLRFAIADNIHNLARDLKPSLAALKLEESSSQKASGE